MSTADNRIEKLTSVRLLELDANDLAQLRLFAYRRFGRDSLAGVSAEDMVQKALTAIVRGQSGTYGRRPRIEDLKSKTTFINYIRSAINSVTEAFFRKCELHLVHEIAQTSTGWSGNCHFVALPGKQSADDDLVMRDLRAELFKRLRQRAPKGFQRTIKLWEEEFLWSTSIPANANRKCRYKVRSLAIRILRQIESDLIKGDRPRQSQSRPPRKVSPRGPRRKLEDCPR